MKATTLLFFSSIFLFFTLSNPIYAWMDYKADRMDQNTCGVNCQRNYFEVIAAGGVSKLTINNTPIDVNGQTGEIVTNNTDWKTYVGQFGIGYVYTLNPLIENSNQIIFFNAIEPQLNLYYSSSNDIQGKISGFTSPVPNSDSDLTVRNTRFMLDFSLTVASWRNVSVYAIAGVGVAWSRLFFNGVTDDDGTSDSTEINLESKSSNQFVWEVGGGLNYLLDNRSNVSISLEYLYTDFGTLRAGESENTLVVTPPNFRIPTQVLLVGLHVPF